MLKKAWAPARRPASSFETKLIAPPPVLVHTDAEFRPWLLAGIAASPLVAIAGIVVLIWEFF